MQSDLRTPILAPGQVWTFAADPIDGQAAVPNTLTVGSPKHYGTGSVGFSSEPVTQGSTLQELTTTVDGFYYDPLDSDREYIIATRGQIVSSVSTTQVCVVRVVLP